MTNPLNTAPAGGPNSFSGMIVGETRTVTFPKAGTTMTLTRTRRPFIYDWVDASNVELAKRRPDLVWVIDRNEEAQLVSRKHYKPDNLKPWRPSGDELERIHAEAASALRAETR